MSQSFCISEAILSCNFREEDSLNSSQLATSQMFQSFCSQATDIYSLCGMMGASLFASIARVKCSQALSLFIQNPQKAYLIRGGSTLAACLAEATGIHSIPKFLKEGEILGGRVEEGWGGWIHTSLTMILMKGTGSLLPPNLVMQHLAQDALMVKLDEVCVSLNLIEGQGGSFIEKMANAEIMSCQMMVSGALTGFCFSEMKIFEAKQELKYQMNQRNSSNRRGFLSNLFAIPQETCEFAVEGGGKLSVSIDSIHSESSPWSKKGGLHSAMVMMAGGSAKVRPVLLPAKGEKAEKYAERIVDISRTEEAAESSRPKPEEGKPSLEIVQALYSLGRVRSKLAYLKDVIGELLVLTAEMKERDGLLVREFSVEGVAKPILIANIPSTFLPENWSYTFVAGIIEHFRRFPDPIRLAVELGIGTAFPSIVLRKLGKAERVIGYDINPHAPILGHFNALLNQVTNVSFSEGNLLDRFPSGKTTADLLMWCLPQKPTNRESGPVNLHDQAEFQQAQGIFEDLYGLGLNARAIEEAKKRLSPNGHIVLTMAGRAQMGNVAKLFADRGMLPHALVERVIPQAPPHDFRAMMEIESQAKFQFQYLTGEGLSLSATEASRLPLTEVYHTLYAIEAEPYQAVAAQAAKEVKRKDEVRWGYTEDPITEDPRLLNVAKTWLSRQLAHELSDKVIAVGPNSEAMLEAVLKLSVVSGRTIGVAGEMEYSPLEKIGEINRFKFRELPDNFAELTATIQAEALEAVILKPSRRILADAEEIEVFLKAAEAQKTLVILLEDHPSRANDPGHTLFATVAKNRDLLQNFVLIQDLRKFGLPVPLSFAVIADSALYAALIHYADVTYSRVSSATQKVATRFFESLLSTPALDEAPMKGSVQRVESDGRMLSDLAKRFRIPAVFESSPITKPRGEDSKVIDMSFGESEWIPPSGNLDFVINPFHLDPAKERAAALQASATYFNQTRGAKFALNELVIGSGVHPLLQATLQGISTLSKKPIEVLVPAPRYGGYYPTVLTVKGARLVRVPTSSQHRFLLTEEDIRSLPSPEPGVKRVLMDNFPTNPAGQYPEDIRQMIVLAGEVDYLLVDEVFGLLNFRKKDSFQSLAAQIERDERLREKTVFYGGLSKEFALGGVRYGFQATHNPEILAATRKSLMTEEDPFAMRAAQYFLPRWKMFVEAHLEYLKPRAKALTQFFSRRGFGVHPPEGGYALFVNLERLFNTTSFIHGEEITSDNFHELLMKHAGIKIKSDQWAGMKAHYRFVFSIDNLPEAIERLGNFFDHIRR